MNEILDRTLKQARPKGQQPDRGEWGERIESGIRLEAAHRSAGRMIRRRGTRSSFPARDRLCQRWCS